MIKFRFPGLIDAFRSPKRYRDIVVICAKQSYLRKSFKEIADVSNTRYHGGTSLRKKCLNYCSSPSTKDATFLNMFANCSISMRRTILGFDTWTSVDNAYVYFY